MLRNTALENVLLFIYFLITGRGVGPTQVVSLNGRVKFMEVSKTAEYGRYFCTSRIVEENYKSVGRKDSPSVYLPISLELNFKRILSNGEIPLICSKLHC